MRVSAQVCKGVIQPRAAASGVGQEVEDRFVSITHPLHALYMLNAIDLLVPVLPSTDGQSEVDTPLLASTAWVLRAQTTSDKRRAGTGGTLQHFAKLVIPWSPTTSQTMDVQMQVQGCESGLK